MGKSNEEFDRELAEKQEISDDEMDKISGAGNDCVIHYKCGKIHRDPCDSGYYCIWDECTD